MVHCPYLCSFTVSAHRRVAERIRMDHSFSSFLTEFRFAPNAPYGTKGEFLHVVNEAKWLIYPPCDHHLSTMGWSNPGGILYHVLNEKWNDHYPIWLDINGMLLEYYWNINGIWINGILINGILMGYYWNINRISTGY